MRWMLAVVLLAGCSAADDGVDVAAAGAPERQTETATAEETPTYEQFDQIDPYLHGFFIAMEDTNMAANNGERALWNYGTRVCTMLDNGETVGSQVESMATEAEVEEPGSLVGAAVSHICDHHMAAAERWVEENS